MLITVSGLFGAGKSTIAKRLSEKLGLEYFWTGKILRDLAKDKGYDLIDFEKKVAEHDPAIDREIDDRQKEAIRKGNSVIDSRLGAWLADDADLRVWLVCPFEIRAKRVSGRDGISVEEARRRIRERDQSDIKRYREFYGIDLSEVSVYDLVLNTNTFDADKIIDIIMFALNKNR